MDFGPGNGWKCYAAQVDKGTHLMFSRHSYAVDAVCVADQDRFVSGGQELVG